MTEEIPEKIPEEIPEEIPDELPVAEDKKKSKSESLIEKAEELAKRIEKANVEAAKYLEKQEQLMAKALLGGKSVGGTVEVKKSEDEIAAEEARKVVSTFYG